MAWRIVKPRDTFTFCSVCVLYSYIIDSLIWSPLAFRRSGSIFGDLETVCVSLILFLSYGVRVQLFVFLPTQFLNDLTDFMTFCTNIMLLKSTPPLYLLISSDQEYQHGGCADFWGGSERSALKYRIFCSTIQYLAVYFFGHWSSNTSWSPPLFHFTFSAMCFIWGTEQFHP